MSESKFAFIMFEKMQTLSDSIKNHFNITYKEAIKLLYNSKLYEALEDEETKMWYYSNFDLMKMFIEEINTGKYTVYGG